MKPTFFKGAAVGAATCFVMLVGTAALAGTGVGGIFNLGQTNSVDATSTLTGSVDTNPQLHVINDGNGPAVRGLSMEGRGVFGRHGGTTGTLAGVEGSTASTDPNAIGLQGSLPPAPDPSAIAIRGLGTNGTGVLGQHSATTGTSPGVQGDTGSTSNSAVGVLGRVTAPSPGNLSSGVRGLGGLIGVWGSGPYGVYGSGTTFGVSAESDQGTAVSAFSNKGDAVVATTYGASDKAALTGTGLYGARAGYFKGRTYFSRDLEIEGSNADIAGASSSCPAGGIAGLAQVPASSLYSSTYASVNNSFNCPNGGSIRTVLAKRQGTGNYCVKFPGLGSLAAVVGNISVDNDDFLAITEDRMGCGIPDGETARAYRVRVRDKDGGYDDTPFTIIAASW